MRINSKLLTSAILLIVFGVSSISGLLFAESDLEGSANHQYSPGNVLTYFRLLPNGYFEPDRGGFDSDGWDAYIDSQFVRCFIDLENGYLHLMGDGAQFDFFVTVFKTNAGGFIAVACTQHEESEGLQCILPEAYELKSHSLSNVSSRVFPAKLPEFEAFELPRIGSVIKTFNGRDGRDGKLYWTGVKFLFKNES